MLWQHQDYRLLNGLGHCLGSSHISCLGLSIEGREAVARVETVVMGILMAATGTGEHDFALVCLLLTATFLTGCCIVFNTTFDGGFVLPFEGRGRTACAGMAGGHFGNVMVAGNIGEHIITSVCLLLMTILSVGRFVDRDTST